MRNALKIMTASLAAMTLSASCAVHEWPETLPADATLKLDFDTALPQFIVLDLNDTRGSKDGRDYQIRSRRPLTGATSSRRTTSPT